MMSVDGVSSSTSSTASQTGASDSSVPSSVSYPPQIIYEEKSPRAWVNFDDVLKFLSSPSSDHLTVGSIVKFLWSSEESGFRHLYLISTQLVANKNSYIYSDLSQYQEFNSNTKSIKSSSTPPSSKPIDVDGHDQDHEHGLGQDHDQTILVETNLNPNKLPKLDAINSESKKSPLSAKNVECDKDGKIIKYSSRSPSD
jgi:hypothetical protein